MEFLLKCKAFISGKGVFDLKEAIEEKRFSPRVRCLIDAQVTLPSGEGIKAAVVEVSLTGMRLSCDRKLSSGALVKIAPVKGEGLLRESKFPEGAVTMQVVWSRQRKTTRDYTAGLKFADTEKNLEGSWAAYVLDRYGIAVGFSTQRRKKSRIPVELSLSIALPLQQVVGTVLDLGIGGMLVSTDIDISKKDILGFRVGPYRHLETLYCNGKIVHQKTDAPRKSYTYGIVFTKMKEKQVSLLNSYLTTLCLEESE
ncbi:MAG: PilZ domain-containing protein [Candidatus Eremiobacteraeota bacterium]|nr:PilZ domain-containing protein [Candidatus Eremiobacteraeota bacterium]